MHRPNFYCDHQVALLKCWGIWPLERKSRWRKYALLAFRYIQITALSISSSGLFVATLFTSDLKQVSSSADVLTLVSSALYKISFMCLFNGRVRKLVKWMDLVFKPVVRNSEGDRFDVKYESRWCTLCSDVPILISTLIAVSYALSPMVKDGEFEKVVHENGTMVNRKLKTYPQPFWVPFKKDSTLVYVAVYFIQGSSFIFAGAVYIVTDAFFFMVIYQVALQMHALSLMLTNLGRRNLDYDYDSTMFDFGIEMEKTSPDENNSVISSEVDNASLSTYSEDNEKLVLDKMRRCVEFHSLLLRITIEIEELNRSMILADILHAMISVSLGLFDTGTGESVYDGVVKLLFLIICIVHQFLNSYFGEIFIQAQEEVGEAAYMSDWTQRSIKYRKYVMMILIRGGKRTILNGGKMYNLCRPSFVLFIKSIFSYYMVLRQANEK